MSVKNRLFFGIVLMTLGLMAPVHADVVELKTDHPERYVVQKGDTLWDISTRFLKDPWRWASVWKINEQIANPHLIYPGDVILLTYVDGKPQLTVQREEPPAPAPPPAEAPAAPPPSGELPPDDRRPIEVPAGETPSGMKIVKLKPRAYATSLREAIPTITPDAIVPFLTEPHVVSKGELERAGYVMIGQDDRVALGNGEEFYARGLNRKKQPAEYYQLFRAGKPLKNPDSGEILAYEAVYLGDAQLLEPGDPSKFVITRVKQEVVTTDRLMEAPEKAALPYYYPRAPEKNIKGRIISALNSVREIGTGTVVTLSLGSRNGIEEGHVLRVMRYIGTRKDPVARRQVKMPDEEVGLVMVFRVFEKVSYALVMDATKSINILDSVRTP